MSTLTVDVDLMVGAGLLPMQRVQLVNRTNGRRWDVFILPGESGNGQVTANLGNEPGIQPGDDLAVWSWEDMQYVLPVAA